MLDFVRVTTDQSSRKFVAENDRIVTFDQDGTLWVEHPLYVQAVFALDRVHILAPQHPEWRTQEPFKSVLSDDPATLGKFTERDWAQIVFLTHAGMSEAEFLGLVRQWLKTATHPRFKRPYTDLVYRPMREVMITCAATDLRSSSSPAADKISSAPTPNASIVFNLSKSSDRVL